MKDKIALITGSREFPLRAMQWSELEIDNKIIKNRLSQQKSRKMEKSIKSNCNQEFKRNFIGNFL